MNNQKFDINKLRVASPCSVGWENMSGDERTRHCEKCSLNVYNISALTAAEVKSLILHREGRLCIRMFRRADGTILTKDCPVGLRAARKRLTAFAGATLAAVLGLFSISFGQKDENKPIDASKIKIERIEVVDRKSELTGTVMDENGAIIPDAQIVLSDGKQEIVTISHSDGNFSLVVPTAGTFDLKVKTTFLGFEEYRLTNLRVSVGERLKLNVELKVDRNTQIVGDLVVEPTFIETTPNTITTITLTPRKLENSKSRKAKRLK